MEDLIVNSKVESISLKPGDIVVISFPMSFSGQVAAHMQEMAKNAFPDNKVLIVCDGGTIKVVSPDE